MNGFEEVRVRHCYNLCLTLTGFNLYKFVIILFDIEFFGYFGTVCALQDHKYFL